MTLEPQATKSNAFLTVGGPAPPALINMSHEQARRLLGDPYVSGCGVEIGAGLSPVLHPGITQLQFLDKRSPEEFKAYFGKSPQYPLTTKSAVVSEHPDGLDFLTAHHVLEHMADPISGLIDWIQMIRDGGVLFVSLPSEYNPCEKLRLKTPVDHLYEDYFFGRSAASYESKSHIYSFVLQWTQMHKAVRPTFWNKKVEAFSRFWLWNVESQNDHDLHWHTLDLQTSLDCVQAAFCLAGFGCEWLVATSSADSHYLLARKCPGPSEAPASLVQFARTIRAVQSQLDRFVG